MIPELPTDTTAGRVRLTRTLGEGYDPTALPPNRPRPASAPSGGGGASIPPPRYQEAGRHLLGAHQRAAARSDAMIAAGGPGTGRPQSKQAASQGSAQGRRTRMAR